MKLKSTFILAALLSLTFSATATADYRDDLVGDLAQIEEKLVALANAVPEDTFSWRPSEGVRSVSEALMHAAGGNYFFSMQLGMEPPEGVDVMGLEKITAKSEVIETLQASFARAKEMIEGTKERELDESVKFFGRDMTLGGLLRVAVSHGHEHLGQMIAYARSNNIAPPWSQGGGQ